MATKLTVVWETNGGYPYTQTKEYTSDSNIVTISSAPEASRIGFTFVNWTLLDEPITSFPYEYTATSEEETIYMVAKWEPVLSGAGRAMIILNPVCGASNDSSDGGSVDVTELTNRVDAIENALDTTGYGVLQVKSEGE